MLMIPRTRLANGGGLHMASEEPNLLLKNAPKRTRGSAGLFNTSITKQPLPFIQPSHLGSSGRLQQRKDKSMNCCQKNCQTSKGQSVPIPNLAGLLVQASGNFVASTGWIGCRTESRARRLKSNSSYPSVLYQKKDPFKRPHIYHDGSAQNRSSQ